MTRFLRFLTVASLTALVTATAAPVFAQTDLVGEWAVRMHEDFWHRMAGPEIGDFTGVPINADGRAIGDAFDASIWSQKGFQCRPHPAPYAMRGPAAPLHIERVLEEGVQRLIAYNIYGTYARSPRTVWMDGRPHPPEDARHTWSGFSTGKWDGDMLTVTTTHLRKGYIQRNGLDSSDMATLTEHFYRFGDHGQYLMLFAFIDDPVYLEEPFVRTTNYVLATNQLVNNRPGGNGGGGNTGPCGEAQTLDEVAGAPKDYVPHHLPGTNTQLHEVADKYDLPFEATRGGAATTYPEYMARIKQLRAAAAPANAAATPTGPRTGFFGSWRLNRVKSTFKENKARTGTALGLDATTVEWRVMKFEPSGDGIKQTVDTRAVANDTGFFREEYTAKFDGKDYPIKIKATALDTVSLKRVDDKTIERVGKIAGQAVETATYAVSPDGKTLTVSVKGQAGGVGYTSVQVFDRQ